MTWTYLGNIDTSPLDYVRLLIGDTDQCDQLLQDQEIIPFLKRYHYAPMNTAIRCCEVIMSKLSRRVNESVGSVRMNFSDQVKAFRELRRDLVNRLATEDMAPYAGGISISDVQIVALNPDRVRPDYTRHMMQNFQVSPWLTGGLANWTTVGSWF